MSRIVFFLFFPALFCSCSQQKTPFEQFKGSWKCIQDSSVFTELWKQCGDSLIGSGVETKGDSVLFTESITLAQRGNDWLYIPIVKGQNNDQPVLFKMAKNAESTFEFTNPEHDFPKKIIYRFVAVDSLIVSVLGEENGKTTGFDLNFIREK